MVLLGIQAHSPHLHFAPHRLIARALRSVDEALNESVACRCLDLHKDAIRLLSADRAIEPDLPQSGLKLADIGHWPSLLRRSLSLHGEDELAAPQVLRMGNITYPDFDFFTFTNAVKATAPGRSSHHRERDEALLLGADIHHRHFVGNVGHNTCGFPIIPRRADPKRDSVLAPFGQMKADVEVQAASTNLAAVGRL